jgi:hypothetical protein
MVRKNQKIKSPDTWLELLTYIAAYEHGYKYKRDYAKNLTIIKICVVHHEISISKLIQLTVADFLDEIDIIQELDTTCFSELCNYVNTAHPTPTDRTASLFGLQTVSSITNMLFNIVGCSTNKIKRLYKKYLLNE